MSTCQICDIPLDATYFDESSVQDAPGFGEEIVLAHYELHRNYSGMLMYFAQFTDAYAANPVEVQTPGFQWQIRCNGQPRDPYLTFSHIINPWGLSGFPIHLRLEEGCRLEFAVRKVSADQSIIKKVGGRLLGRTWFNTACGGMPNGL